MLEGRSTISSSSMRVVTKVVSKAVRALSLCRLPIEGVAFPFSDTMEERQEARRRI